MVAFRRQADGAAQTGPALKLFATLALIVAAGAAAAVQEPQRFRSRADLVTVDVLVTSGRRVLSGLSAGDFELLDNGVPQSIQQLYVEQLPLNVIMVLDTSASVAGERLEFLKKGALAVVDKLRPQDRAAIVAFSEQLGLQAPLNGDRSALRDAIAALRVGGSTALFDAAYAGLALRGAAATRTLILLFSDGVDTSSILGPDRVLHVASRSDATVYAVGIRDAAPAPLAGSAFAARLPAAATDDRFLGRIARDTGGRLIYAEENRELASTFGRVIEEFNSRYVLGYVPAGVPAKGWHQISVRLKKRQGTVLARRGYFGH